MKPLEIDCRKCANCDATNDKCKIYGKDPNSAVEKCAENAFMGYNSAQAETGRRKLSLIELRVMKQPTPVWVHIRPYKKFGESQGWCLCRNGIIYNIKGGSFKPEEHDCAIYDGPPVVHP